MSAQVGQAYRAEGCRYCDRYGRACGRHTVGGMRLEREWSPLYRDPIGWRVVDTTGPALRTLTGGWATHADALRWADAEHARRAGGAR